MKRCTGCGKSKPFSDFYRDSSREDGYRYRCKACHAPAAKRWLDANPEPAKKCAKRWYEENSDRAIEKNRRWRRENPEKAAAIGKRQREKHPEKYQARHELENAVRGGRIQRPDSCEDCGNRPDYALHGHHPDYSKPLEVEWLCRSCHNARHQAAA